MRFASSALVIGGIAFMALAPATVDVQARTQTVAATTPTEAAVSVTAAHQIVITVNQLVNRSPMTLTASIDPSSEAASVSA